MPLAERQWEWLLREGALQTPCVWQSPQEGSEGGYGVLPSLKTARAGWATGGVLRMERNAKGCLLVWSD